MTHSLARAAWNSSISCILLCVLANPGRAEEYAFHWANPLPQGNALYSLAFEDGEIGLAVGDRGAVLRTTDRGQTWIDWSDFEVFSADLRSVIAVAPEEYLAVGENPGIFRSVDGGLTWSSVPNPSVEDLLDIEQIGPTSFSAIGEWGDVLRSDDGGVTWLPMTSPLDMPQEGQFWWDDQHGYLAGWFTAMETTDGGVTWTDLPDVGDLGAQLMMDIHFLDQQDGWILDHFNTFRTTDGGASWFEKHGPFAESPIYQEDAVFFDASHRVIITFLEGAGIWETLDDGESWSPRYLRNRTAGYADIDELADGSLVTCSSFGDLLRSTDQGQTWTNFTHCPGDADRSHVEAMGSSPGGLAFAGGRDFL